MIQPMERKLNERSAAARAIAMRVSARRYSVSGALALVVVLVLSAAPAIAFTTREPLPFSPIDGSSTGENFRFPTGIAVDETTGNIFVNDVTSEGNVTDVFGAEGGLPLGVASPYQITGFTFTFERSSVAVDNSATSPSKGTLYVVDVRGNAVKKYTLSPITETYEAAGELTASPAFFEPLGDAVDAHGDVFVADYGSSSVVEFSAAGSELARIDTSTAFGQPSSVALDSAGDLFVGAYSGSGVYEFPANGSGQIESQVFTQILPPGSGATGVAIDTAANVLYVALGDHVNEYNAGTLALQGEFGTGSLHSTTRLAVNSSSGVVYVADNGFAANPKRVVAFGPAVTLPDVSTGAATALATSSATLTGTVNPDETVLSDCHFEYTDDADFQANGYSGANARSVPCVPAAAAIPADATGHSVTADVTGLSPNTTYRFRLVAANANGSNHGQDHTFITRSAPLVDGESVANASSSEALLRAKINPLATATSYHFEFGSTISYGTNVPVPDAGVGSGSGDVAVSQLLTGLTPATTYHFRVVAVNSLGTTDGPDRTLVTYPSPPSALPDGRGYELVTPPDKNGQSVGPNDLADAAVAGDGHVFYITTTLGAFGDSPNGMAGEYVASRGSSGWQSTSVSAPAPAHPEGSFQDVPRDASSDFSTIVLGEVASLDPRDQDGGVEDLYARHADGAFDWISQNETANPLTVAAAKPEYAGGSVDMSHVIFETLPADDDVQNGAAFTGSRALYEWTGGRTRRVGVGNNGLPISACGEAAGGPSVGHNDSVNAGGYTARRAISSDGSRIFFESPDPGGAGDPSCSPEGGGLQPEVVGVGTQPVELYLRENGATTTEISLSQKTGSVGTPASDTSAEDQVRYRGAAADGSRVFFTSGDQLTNDPAAAGGGLYAYDVASAHLSFIATGAPLLDIGTTSPAISPDGSHVYFIGEAPGGPSGELGLYLWNEGQVTYISPAPSVSNSHDLSNAISDDGNTLTFVSDVDLTTFDSHAKAEVYVYQAGSGQLVCISCDPNGAVPTGDASLSFRGAAFTQSSLVNRSVSSDGSKVFFQSAQPLVPQATNGLNNVYEYEHGSVYLLSDGNGPSETKLVGASSDGSDVIVSTRDSLVAQDRDGGLGDLYDIRVGATGGPASTPPGCQGETCKGLPSPAPQLPSAASGLLFSSPVVGSAPLTPPRPTVKILGRTLHGSTFLVTVNAPGPGSITVTGPGLRGVRRSVAKAGTYQLKLSLTAKAFRRLRSRHRLKVALRVTYASLARGLSSTSVASATLRRSTRSAAG
jgi:hypothetical protein